MGFIVAGVDCADPRQTLQRVARLAKRLQRRSAVVMRGRISRFGSDCGVEMGNGFAMPALGCSNHPEIVDDGRMIGSQEKRATVGGLGLIETPGLVLGDRIGNALLKWVRHDSR